MRLAHKIKHLVACVFGSNLKLSADVMFYKLLEKLIVLILHHIVVSYTRTDKYTLDIFYGTYLSEHIKILAVIYLQCRARFGSKALFTLAKSRLFLLVAGGPAEVCGRTADIVDISLEARFFRKVDCLVYNRFLASCLYSSALMQGYRTEITITETTSVMSYGKLNFLYARNSAALFVARVIRFHIRQLVCLVKFALGKASLRRILYKHHISVTLYHSFTVNLVLLVILLTAGFCICFLILADYLEAVALHRTERSILRLGKITGTSYVVYLRQLFALGKLSVKLYYSKLAHSVHQKLSAAVNQY